MTLNLVVGRTEEIAPGIRELTFVRPGGRLPRYPAGAHIVVECGDGRRNAYSLTGCGIEPDAYRIAVLHKRGGDGGSAYVHGLRVGDRVRASPPRSAFAPVATARRHLLIAGGIGITPMLAHVRAALLLDQREGSLWADAGIVTFAADWSMRFDVGMRFLEVHGPVPRIHELGIISRAERFLMRLQPGEEYRRTNWSMSVDRRLDQSTEIYPEWGPDRRAIADAGDDELARRLHLRVEVQHLVRLGHSGAIMFLIRTYLASLAELATVPAWRQRLGHVLAELPGDMADYKGLIGYRDAAARWLLAG